MKDDKKPIVAQGDYELRIFDKHDDLVRTEIGVSGLFEAIERCIEIKPKKGSFRISRVVYNSKYDTWRAK